MTKVCAAYGILGLIKFFNGYYMIVIKSRFRVGSLRLVFTFIKELSFGLSIAHYLSEGVQFIKLQIRKWFIFHALLKVIK